MKISIDSTAHQGTHQQDANLISNPASAALLSVDATREAIHAMQQEFAAQLEVARQECAEMRAELGRSQEEVARVTAQCNHYQTERDGMQAALVQAHIERDQARTDCERWRHDCENRAAALEALTAQVQRQNERNRDLRHELLEVYQDLRAEDLPTLITRIGMNLTGCEYGIMTGPQGETTVASVGMDDISPEVSNALYEFTRRAAREEDSIECNDADALPAGANLVNIACAPVVLRGNLSGVLLVANKRSGAFTDDDVEILLSIGRHAGIALENQRLHCALADSFRSTIAVLADAIEAKDPYTRGHCESVAQLAVEVARRFGIKGDALDEMHYAALLHDVGKIGIPDGILLKPGKLLPEEFSIIQKHSSIGCDLVKRVPSLEAIAPIVLHHHERLDGSGYPDGQSGSEIMLSSRIIGAVDAFDAMTSTRPYRDALSPDVALSELHRCSGNHFDPEVVTVLASIVNERQRLAA